MVYATHNIPAMATYCVNKCTRTIMLHPAFDEVSLSVSMTVVKCGAEAMTTAFEKADLPPA